MNKKIIKLFVLSVVLGIIIWFIYTLVTSKALDRAPITTAPASLSPAQ